VGNGEARADLLESRRSADLESPALATSAVAALEKRVSELVEEVRRVLTEGQGKMKQGGLQMSNGTFVRFWAGVGVLVLIGCARSEKAAAPPAERATAAAPAAAVDEISVEFRTLSVPGRLAPGEASEVKFEAKNVGPKPWLATGEFPLVFGYHWEEPAGEAQWQTVVWDDSNRGTLPSDVAPGQSVVVTLPVRALPRPCAGCRLVVAPLLEMKAWSQTARLALPIVVS
jgi:hypothetical protein